MNHYPGITLKDLVFQPETTPERTTKTMYAKISFYAPPSFHDTKRYSDNVSALFDIKTGDIISIEKI